MNDGVRIAARAVVSYFDYDETLAAPAEPILRNRPGLAALIAQLRAQIARDQEFDFRTFHHNASAGVNGIADL